MEHDGIYGAKVADVRCEQRTRQEFFCRGDYTAPPPPFEDVGIDEAEQRAALKLAFSGPAAWTVTVDERGYWDAVDLDEDDLAR